MITPQRVWSKVRREQVLNLAELAIASGYDRAVLSKMDLPLQVGKISFQDFKRVMQKRQDHHERQRARLRVMKMPDVPSGSAGKSQRREAADMFYERSSRRAGKAALRPAPQFQLQSSA